MLSSDPIYSNDLHHSVCTRLRVESRARSRPARLNSSLSAIITAAVMPLCLGWAFLRRASVRGGLGRWRPYSTQPQPASGRVDHYQVLAITPDATQTEVREAFFRLVKSLHPDINPDPEAGELFHRVQTAFQVLKDPKRRQDYDQRTGVEKSLKRRMDDQTVAWSTRRMMMNAAPWSEKLLKDVLKASALRSIKRQARPQGQGRGAVAIEDLVRHRVWRVTPRELRSPELRDTPQGADLKRMLALVLGVFIACQVVYVTALALAPVVPPQPGVAAS